jgi:hypothetical protein
MNERGQDNHGQSYNNQHLNLLTDRVLGERISCFFHEQAEHMQLTPELRAQFTRRGLSHRKQQPRALLATTLACAAILTLALTSSFYLTPHPSVQHQIQYAALKEMNVSAELAQGGQLISIDPTEQHLIYQAANQSGVYYMTNLNNPLGSNTLVMRYAQDMAWSPDGAALVATIAPEGALSPLLALVPTGQYMHLLGHNALAANWSPKDKQQITYIVQEHGRSQVWSTDTNGQSNRLLATIPLSLLVKHMYWSPDGHYLAFAVTSTNFTNTSTYAALKQPAHAISVVDMQTHSMHTFTAQENFVIGNVEWSPKGDNLAYEQIDNNGKSVLQAVNITRPTDHFDISPQRPLLGWSWSPDGRALAYSDGGVLHAHISYGQAINFSQNQSQLVSPLWLKNGTILCMNIKQGIGNLALLSPLRK